MAQFERSGITSADFDWRNPHSAPKLSRAVRSGSLREVKKLIGGGCALDLHDNRGWTALHEAALSNKNSEIAKCIISAGAYVDHKTVDGETPLFLACKHKAEKIVQALLEAGCEVNSLNNDCWTPLHVACTQPNIAVIKLLIGAGADLNAKDDEERSPVYLALESKNIDALKTLIAAGADMYTKDFFSRSPLQYACYVGDIDVFNVLIDLFGKDSSVINQQTPEGWTLLMEAAQFNNHEIAKKLIEYGADTKMVDNRNLLALHIAAHSENTNNIDLLLRHTPKEDIEKYSSIGPNMTHYRSLPCLIIDKGNYDGLVYLFEAGLSGDVLTCPAKMGDRLVSPISFLILHANADDNNKVKILDYLLSFDFLVDPQYFMEDFGEHSIMVVRPIEAAICRHRPDHGTTCFCPTYLSRILEKGVSPDLDCKKLRFYLFQKAVRYGFTAGLGLLLRYSNWAEPGDILEMILMDICRPEYLWTGAEMNVVKYLILRSMPDLSRCALKMSKALSRGGLEERKYNTILPFFNLVKSCVQITSLKWLCRSSARRFIKQQSRYSKTPFKTYVRNIKMPKSILQYILFDEDI